MVQRIKALEKETRLLVVDKETDEFLRGLSLACTEEMARSGVSIPEPVPVPQASVKGNGAVWKQQLALSSGEPKRLSRRHSAENRKKVSAASVTVTLKSSVLLWVSAKFKSNTGWFLLIVRDFN